MPSSFCLIIRINGERDRLICYEFSNYYNEMRFAAVIIPHISVDMNEFFTIISSLVRRDNQNKEINQLQRKYLFWSISMLFSNKPNQEYITSILFTMTSHSNLIFLQGGHIIRIFCQNVYT